MMMAAVSREEDDVIAAELAFGLLDAEQQDYAEERLAVDANFAQLYRDWRDRAAGLFSGLNQIPRPSVWSAIEARISFSDAQRADRHARTALRWWQASTAFATAAAIILGLIVAERPPVGTVGPRSIEVAALPTPTPLVAILSDTSSKAVVTVSFDRAAGRLVSAPSRLQIGAHAAELWIIPTGGKPRSLGLISVGTPRATSPHKTALSAISPGATLAISVEPIGGSPTGQPTGPVILSGTIVTT